MLIFFPKVMWFFCLVDQRIILLFFKSNNFDNVSLGVNLLGSIFKTFSLTYQNNSYFRIIFLNYIFQYSTLLFLEGFNYADVVSAWSIYLIIFGCFYWSHLNQFYYFYPLCFLFSFLQCLAFPVLLQFYFISVIVLVLFLNLQSHTASLSWTNHFLL